MAIRLTLWSSLATDGRGSEWTAIRKQLAGSLLSLSVKMSYHQISWSLKATRSAIKWSYRFEIWQEPTKFYSNQTILNSYLACSRYCKIWRLDFSLLGEWRLRLPSSFYQYGCKLSCLQNIPCNMCEVCWLFCVRYIIDFNGMMMSSNGNIFSASLAFCAGNSPVTGEFPVQRPVMQGFDVFFDLRLNQ